MKSYAKALLTLVSLSGSLSAIYAATPEITSLQNTANPGYSTKNLAPSSFYDAIGTNLCPNVQAYEDIYPGGTSGSLQTNLSGCGVEIDGQAVAVTFVSPTKVTFKTSLTGSTVVVTSTAGKSAPVGITMVASDPAFFMQSYQSFPVPFITDGMGAQVGTLIAPINYNANNPGSTYIEIAVNGIGAMTDNNGNVQNSLTKGYFYCAVAPKVYLDGTLLPYVQDFDGVSAMHNFCKQTGLVVVLGLELPKAYSPTNPHFLVMGNKTSVVY